ncbi:class I glutamine amidotransferase-like protein [Mycena leptocephala]|nr:class I glutamine amidotransferase-like protein [Mycena leptocephala]
MPAVLFVFTSATKTLTGAATGWWLPEAAHPYYILSPHASIDFASPNGEDPPVDQRGVEMYASDQDCIKFLADETVKTKLASAKKLSAVNAKDYDAIFYVGGHGPVIDLAFDPVNIKLASEFYQAGKIVAAVCHGPAALVGATDADGKSIFAGKSFTGYSNAEEDITQSVKEIPFLLEDKIVGLGGKYAKADEPLGAKVVVDGTLYTGQNPASAAPLAEAILAGLVN